MLETLLPWGTLTPGIIPRYTLRMPSGPDRDCAIKNW